MEARSEQQGTSAGLSQLDETVQPQNTDFKVQVFQLYLISRRRLQLHLKSLTMVRTKFNNVCMLLLSELVIGIQAAPTMCDVGVQCDLIHPIPPMTWTPVKGKITSVVDDGDPFELTKEKESETEVTESTMYWDTTTSEDEDQVSVEKQLTFLVFESALMLLFASYLRCGSTLVSNTWYVVGSFLRIKQECSQCNNKYVWESQPYIQNIPAGNILTSAAILYSGSLPAKGLRIFKTLNCATISRKTFYRHQKEISLPSHSCYLGEGPVASAQ